MDVDGAREAWRRTDWQGCFESQHQRAKEESMPVEYQCPSCNETFREQTVEAVLKRAAAHDHTHHGGRSH
jgi:hypothetical protein